MDASIIIPTFNRLWSLPDAIASCPRGDNIETIVVDDGSSDETWDWLHRQHGITAIRQENWGKAAAIEAGLRVAKGRYVKFLDSDDQLIEEAVKKQLAFTLSQAPEICVSSYIAVYDKSGVHIPHIWQDCGDFLSQQLGECDSSHYSAYFFRRDFLTDIHHRPEFASRDDRMFVLECALKMPDVAIFMEPTLLHHHHDRARIQFQPGSSLIVANWQERKIFEKVVALLDAREMLTLRRRVAMSNNLWELACRTAGYNMREGREVLDWLYQLNPEFTIPESGYNRAYRLFGFSAAQRLVNAARFTRNRYRGLRSTLTARRSQTADA